MIIDITNEVFTKLKTSIKDVNFTKEFPSNIPKFPLVTFSEISNIANISTIDSSGEQYNDIGFEINIFTNSQTKETDAKKIRNRIDEILSDVYGMTRIQSTTIENVNDITVYRYVMRYTCVVSKNKDIYRR